MNLADIATWSEIHQPTDSANQKLEGSSGN
jgi:hypothetical protein